MKGLSIDLLRHRALSGGILAHVAELVFVALIYFVCAKAGLALASINPSATPIWPPTGFALAVLILRGAGLWPAVFLGALVANATTAGSLYTSCAIATGNTLEAVVGCQLVNALAGGRNTFSTPANVAKFALISMAATTLSASIGVGSLALGGYAEWPNFLPIWTTWWLGDLAGALVVTPILILWYHGGFRSMKASELIQSVLVFAVAALIGLIAFSPLITQIPNRGPLAFLAVLPLMWAALGRDQRDTATVAAILSCFAVWGTVLEHGPFEQANVNDSFLLLLAFTISTVVPSLALSADITERKRHQEHIELIMGELSHRSKNLFAVVQSMAHQVATKARNFEDFQDDFSSRLQALAGTHDLLISKEWRGADIRDVIRTQMRPFVEAERRLRCEGPVLLLTPRAAEQIGLALHELATNAARHGAFAVSDGIVDLRWETKPDGTVGIVWRETGYIAVEPEHRGFGHLVLTKAVPLSLQGKASLDFQPSGLIWTLCAPSTEVLLNLKVVDG
jgi:two-component sensor histidine kinase/integral membrane sensor domain MASE1